MEITLEKIELVKDRTGVSYKEAKEALEFAEGNVVDAIIYIEDNIDASFVKKDENKFNEFKKTITETVRKGNVNRIKIYKGEELVLNLPLTAGIVGLVLFQWWGLIVATLATGITKCRVELVKEDGSIIDVTDKATSAFETVKDKSSVIVDEVAEKANDIYATAKDKGTGIYEAAKDKGADLYATAKGTAESLLKKTPAEAPAEETCCCEPAAEECCCEPETEECCCAPAEETCCCEEPKAEEPACCCEKTE